jgi:MFS family permease
MKKPLMFYFGSEIFLSFGIGMATYAQPFLYKAGHLSDASIGILFAVNSASSGLFALVLGPVADRVGASRMFKLSTLLMGIGFLWMGFATAFWGWFASAVLSGLAVLAGACIALVAPVIRYFVVANDVKSHRMFKLPSKRIVLMSLYAVLFGTAIGLFRPFATLVLNGHFGMNDELTSAISAATLFMISLGSLLVSPLLRRLRHGRTLLLAFVASILFTLLMAGTGNPWVFAGALLVSTILTSVPGPIVDAMFLDMTPQTDYSQMFGIRVFGNSAGSAIGAYGGGILMSHAVLGGLLTISSGLLIVSCLYLFWLLARVTKRWQSGVSTSAQRGQFEV